MDIRQTIAERMAQRDISQAELARLARENPAALKAAPVTAPVGRLDEVAAARNMDLAFSSSTESA